MIEPQYMVIADRVEMSVFAVNALRVENWKLVGERCWYYVRYAKRALLRSTIDTTLDTAVDHFLEIADCLREIEG